MDDAVLARGYASCKRVTREHARSFYFASFALFGMERNAAFALYAFCRRLDDLVDEGTVDVLPERLVRARRIIRALYLDDAALDAVQKDSDTWVLEELYAVREVVRLFGIPEAPLQHLVSGMEMDLVQSRYPTFAALLIYCYRVAGTVGLLLAPVLGCSDERALPAADALGRAMQLTNILRDVAEDYRRGRVYLAQEDCAAFGVDERMLVASARSAAMAKLVREYIQRARALYSEAAVGIGALSLTGRVTTRLMGELYGAILEEIEARNFDVLSERVHVPTRRKLWIVLRTLFGVRRVLRSATPNFVALIP